MAAKKFGLRCKIFMGAKDIKRQRPNVEAMRKNMKLCLLQLEVKHLLMLLVNA